MIASIYSDGKKNLMVCIIQNLTVVSLHVTIITNIFIPLIGTQLIVRH